MSAYASIVIGSTWVLFQYISRSGTAGSQCSSTFNFGGNLPTAFHSGSYISHQQCTLVPFSQYPFQHLFVDSLMTISILIGVK